MTTYITTHTNSDDNVTSLEFQVDVLREALDQVIGLKFKLVKNRDPDEFKNEIHSILCSFKHPYLPSEWFKSYRKIVLSQVLETALSYFEAKYWSTDLSDDQKIKVIYTCIDLFDESPTDRLELAEFLLNFKAISTINQRLPSKFYEHEIVDNTINKLFTEAKELKIQILKNYPENTQWHHFDGKHLSITCYLMIHYNDLLKDGYEDLKLEYLFLKFVFNNTFGFTVMLPTPDDEENKFEKYWFFISQFLLKTDNKTMEKLIDEEFKFTNDYKTSLDVMLDFATVLFG